MSVRGVSWMSVELIDGEDGSAEELLLISRVQQFLLQRVRVRALHELFVEKILFVEVSKVIELHEVSQVLSEHQKLGIILLAFEWENQHSIFRLEPKGVGRVVDYYSL